MIGRDFYSNINSSDEFEWLGVKEGDEPTDDTVFVEHKPTGFKYAVTVPAILEHDWDVLNQILTGKRKPQIMEHITRIVGYYSMLNNWNRSKIAELHDRHKGDYSVHAESPKIEDFISAGAAQAV